MIELFFIVGFLVAAGFTLTIFSLIEDKFVYWIIGVVLLGAAFTIVNLPSFDTSSLTISNSTAYEICISFTNDSSVVASTKDGNLICEISPAISHIVIRGGR